LEDKIVQQATVLILTQVYEIDFLGFSYGFRPNRGQHDALDALHVAIMKRKVNWVLDLDISKFFDTSVLGFQRHADAVSCLNALTLRLDKFGLKIHPDKTKLIRFGRYALQQYAEKPSIGKPDTFNFLGFTHYIGRKRSGEVIVKRKTKRKKAIEQLKHIKQELRKRLHDKLWNTGRWLRSVVQGHINYYGVPFNSKALCQFVHEVRRLWLKALKRRSQRHRMNWFSI
jgi:RNA-directed DNA polymerase